MFALAYVEKRSYIKVSREMPSLSPAEVESEWRRLGLGDLNNAEAH